MLTSSLELQMPPCFCPVCCRINPWRGGEILCICAPPHVSTPIHKYTVSCCTSKPGHACGHLRYQPRGPAVASSYERACRRNASTFSSAASVGEPPASFMRAEATTRESCATRRAARSQVSSAARSQRRRPSSTVPEIAGSSCAPGRGCVSRVWDYM